MTSRQGTVAVVGYLSKRAKRKEAEAGGDSVSDGDAQGLNTTVLQKEGIGFQRRGQGLGRGGAL